MVFYGGVIFWLSQQSLDLERDLPIPWGDKLAHLGEYGLLGFLLLRALSGSFPRWSLRAIVGLALVLTILYGVGDEWHQSWVPLRTPDPLDLMADALGAALAAGFWIWQQRRGQATLTPVSFPHRNRAEE